MLIKKTVDILARPGNNIANVWSLGFEMHRLFLLFLMVVPAHLLASPLFFPMVDLDRWGYIDAQGDWVVEPTYAWTTPFHEGLAAVTEDGVCWRFIDAGGAPAFEPQFCGQGWSRGALDTGQIIPQSAVAHYSEGLFPVLDAGSVVYADREGAIVIRGDYTAAYPFAEGRGRIRTREHTYGFVDEDGTLVIPAIYEDALDFSEGLAAAAVRNANGQRRWGYIDRDGAWVIEPQLYRAQSFSEGLAAFEADPASHRDGHYAAAGYLDPTGAIEMQPRFRSAGPFREGFAPVRNGRHHGYIDRNEKLVIAARYTDAQPFAEGLAAVKDDSGWHFIDTAGERAFAHPMLDAVRELGSFTNGLARAVFNLRPSGFSMSLGSGDTKVFDNAYYGYFNRQGELVAVPSEAQRATLLARVDAAEAAAAEEQARAEQAEAAAREAALAGCADEIVYGDPSFANILEFSFEGKLRRLHFEAMEVEQIRGRYDIRVPRIVIGDPERHGWVNAGPASASLSPTMGGTLQGSPIGMRIVLEPGASFRSEQAQLQFWVLPSLDCLQEAPGFPSPRDFFDHRKSDFDVTWDKSPWLTFDSRLKAADATLRLVISTPARRPPADAAPAAARYLDPDAVEARGTVYAGLDVIHVEPAQTRGQNQMRSPFTLPLPATGDRLARLIREGAEVYEFQVLESDLIVVDQHRITPEAGERDERRIFEVPFNPLGQSLDELALDAATRVDRFVISRVSHGALPPLRLADETPVDTPRRPATLALDALPAILPPVRLNRLEPLAITLGDDRLHIRLTLRSTVVEGRALLEHVQEWEVLPAPSAAEAQIIEEMGAEAYQALQTLFAEEADWPFFWANEDERTAFLGWITPLFGAMGVPIENLETIREAGEAFVLMEEHLGEALLDSAFLVFEDRHLRGQAEAAATASPGPTVLIDPATGWPVTRTERLPTDREGLTLEVAVAYGDPVMRLQARNEAQGADALELPLPEGLFDARQVLNLIPFLNLVEGEPQTLYYFDLAAHQRVVSSNAGTFYTAHLEPRVSRLSLALEGRETLASADRDIPVLRLGATLVGSLPPPLGRLLEERPALDAQGAQVFEVLVRAEAPHHLLRIRVGDQELRVDLEDPAAVVEAAATGMAETGVGRTR